MTQPQTRAFDSTVWRVLGDPLIAAARSGPLSGETVAVKDLFAVTGFAIGAGVPEYLATQALQSAHAGAVLRLLNAGADIRGIARTDQFAYSLAGDNEHYGTPENPAVREGLPGGSSSGSTTAVSRGEATIGLGTDTTGSIRVPASYQGLWGLRTTHGAVQTDGLLPLAPDFDTVGLLTRTPELLARATAALLSSPDGPATVPESVGAALPESCSTETTFGNLTYLFDVNLPKHEMNTREVTALDLTSLGSAGIDLEQLAEAVRVHQAFQAWQHHGRWLREHPCALLGAPAKRFKAASQVSVEDDRRAFAILTQGRAMLDELLQDHVLSLPSAASAAPVISADPAHVQAVREATLRLTCIAGITGRPAVSAPLTSTPDGPIGTCFIGPRGSDLALVRLAASCATGPI